MVAPFSLRCWRLADNRSRAEQRAAEEREQEQLERFLAHAVRTPVLQARLKSVDPYGELTALDLNLVMERLAQVDQQVLALRQRTPGR